MRISEGLTYGDVLLEPQYSDINSRDNIDITTDFLGLKIKPIISSPMDHVSSSDMVLALGGYGYYGIFHRFKDLGELRKEIFLTHEWKVPFGVAIGVKDPAVFAWLKTLPPVHSICIDVAHGDHKLVIDRIKLLKDSFPDTKVIAGNVATYDGYGRLVNAGADAIRVGIGSGSACTTRATTGIGVPQLTAILDTVEAKRSFGGQVIADGGIESAGDIVKALAAGADIVMLGKMLAGHDESPGEVIVIDGKKMKPYRGQSMLGTNGHRNSPEGIAGLVPYRGGVINTLNQLEGWIRSGLSYIGAKDLTSLRERASFIKVSPATQLESNTRIMEIQ